MKTPETLQAEQAIYKATHKMGVAACYEVTIGWVGRERVDYMTIDTKDTIRCYEIKVSKSDFHSKCKHSFVGHLNYFVVPETLYDEIKDEIPPGVGVYTVNSYGHAISIKKAVRRAAETEKLKSFMIRSLDREAAKEIKAADPRIIMDKDREIARLTRDIKNKREEHKRLECAVVEKLGRRWIGENI